MPIFQAISTVFNHHETPKLIEIRATLKGLNPTDPEFEVRFAKHTETELLINFSETLNPDFVIFGSYTAYRNLPKNKKEHIKQREAMQAYFSSIDKAKHPQCLIISVVNTNEKQAYKDIISQAKYTGAVEYVNSLPEARSCGFPDCNESALYRVLAGSVKKNSLIVNTRNPQKIIPARSLPNQAGETGPTLTKSQKSAGSAVSTESFESVSTVVISTHSDPETIQKMLKRPGSHRASMPFVLSLALLATCYCLQAHPILFTGVYAVSQVVLGAAALAGLAALCGLIDYFDSSKTGQSLAPVNDTLTSASLEQLASLQARARKAVTGPPKVLDTSLQSSQTASTL